MRRAPRIAVLALAALLALAGGTAHAQPVPDRPGAQRREGGRMSEAERQQLREDLRRQHAMPAGNEERARRYAEWQRLSPEQRAGVRRQLRDANRNLDRHRR